MSVLSSLGSYNVITSNSYLNGLVLLQIAALLESIILLLGTLNPKNFAAYLPAFGLRASTAKEQGTSNIPATPRRRLCTCTPSGIDSLVKGFDSDTERLKIGFRLLLSVYTTSRTSLSLRLLHNAL